MNVRGVDLNLLTHLHVLIEERHVTRAAARVGLTQPAMSNALDRCRQLFGDALLERSGGEMRLTPRGQILAPQIAGLMRDIEAVVSPRPVELRDVQQTVCVLMAHMMAATIGPALYRRLSETAPGINLAIQAWNGSDQGLRDLERGELQLALSIFPELGADFRRLPVLEEAFAVIMRRDHPAAADFNLEQWLAWPHLMFSGYGETRGEVDDLLQQIGRTRRVAMVAPSYSMAAPLVVESDLIGLAPRAAVGPEWFRRVTLLEPPIALPGFTLHLAWHRRSDADLGVQHVARLIQEALQARAGRPLGPTGE